MWKSAANSTVFLANACFRGDRLTFPILQFSLDVWFFLIRGRLGCETSCICLRMMKPGTRLCCLKASVQQSSREEFRFQVLLYSWEAIMRVATSDFKNCRATTRVSIYELSVLWSLHLEWAVWIPLRAGEMDLNQAEELIFVWSFMWGWGFMTTVWGPNVTPSVVTFSLYFRLWSACTGTDFSVPQYQHSIQFVQEEVGSLNLNIEILGNAHIIALIWLNCALHGFCPAVASQGHPWTLQPVLEAHTVSESNQNADLYK